VRYPGFLKLHADRLSMPIEMGERPGLFSALTDKYKKYAIEYYKPGRIPSGAALRRSRLRRDLEGEPGIRCAAADGSTVISTALPCTRGRWGICRRPSG